MKLFFLLSAVFILEFSASAQAPLSLGYGTNAADSIPIDSIASGLARLALNNPALGEQKALAEAANWEYKAQKTAWLDLARVSGNLNEFTIKGRSGSTPNYFYPRYNIGAIVPLGVFTNQPKQTKAQYYRYQAQAQNVKAQEQALRMQILATYLDYVRNQKLYELQEEALQDATFAMTKTEESFSKGDVGLDVYTATSKRLNQEKVTKIALERDLLLGKAELESIIGMPLTEALAKVKSAYRRGPRR